MKFKKATQFYGLLAIVLSVILVNTPVYSELCNNQNSSMCMEALDKNNIALDKQSSFSNINSVTVNFKEIPYGIAVIEQLQLYNSGNTDIMTISSNTALSFPWAYFDIQGIDYVGSESADYIWSLYSSSGLVIKSGNRKSFDIAFTPLPEGAGLSENESGKFVGMQSHLFQKWNPFDVRLNSMSFEVAVTGYARGSLGKTFSVDVNDLGGNSVISIAPVMTNVDLEENEYILVYFEIIQKDGNPYKEVIILHQDETAILAKSLISGQVDNSGITASYSHRKFSNGNVLLRSRDTKNETKTKYWLLFKSEEPINLECYKRTISATGSGYDTTGTTEADLKFVYADLEGKRVEELKGVYAGENNSTPTNRQPYTPSNPIPSNNSTNISSDNLKLQWTSGDPDGNNVADTVYFSDSSANITSNENLLPSPYTPTVINGKTYYWKVVSTDGLLTTEGPVWSFTVNIAPVETEAVEFFNSNNVNISQSGLSLKKGESAIISVKIDPPSAGSVTFTPKIEPSDNVSITDVSLIFYSGASIGGFKLTAIKDITVPVKISLETTNTSYKKDDGTPYTLTIIGNNPPTITSNGAGDTAQITVKEKQVFITQVTVSSKDSSTLSYTKGGEDKDKFTIYNDGVLIFKEAPDYSNPTDSNKDNVYNVNVLVEDSNGSDSQEITVIVEDEVNSNKAPVLPLLPKFPNNDDAVYQSPIELSWDSATDAENDPLTYIVEYWTLSNKSDKQYLDVEVGKTLVSLKNIKDNTIYYWRVLAIDGQNIVYGKDWSFKVELPKVPLPTTKSEIKDNTTNLSKFPVTPTTADRLGQPLAVGDLTEGLTLSYSYPAYSSDVDIYILMEYNGSFFFITKDENNGGFDLTETLTPLFSKLSIAKSGTIFSIPTNFLIKQGFKGKYSFYSGVTPTNDFFNHYYDITMFSITIGD
ncbi:MAG: fibronectin type III domain-containing protein [Desulfamplus sp.]|nr:fibronectin type III domain-containing protein [Desulfamplus sp.]